MPLIQPLMRYIKWYFVSDNQLVACDIRCFGSPLIVLQMCVYFPMDEHASHTPDAWVTDWKPKTISNWHIAVRLLKILLFECQIGWQSIVIGSVPLDDVLMCYIESTDRKHVSIRERKIYDNAEFVCLIHQFTLLVCQAKTLCVYLVFYVLTCIVIIF